MDVHVTYLKQTWTERTQLGPSRHLRRSRYGQLGWRYQSLKNNMEKRE